MRLEVRVRAKPWLESFSSHQVAQVLEILCGEASELVAIADRRLAIPGASSSLMRARDRAARAIAGPDEIRLVLDVHGPQIRSAEIALAGALELKDAIQADVLRTFARRTRSSPKASREQATAPQSGAERKDPR